MSITHSGRFRNEVRTVLVLEVFHNQVWHLAHTRLRSRDIASEQLRAEFRITGLSLMPMPTPPTPYRHGVMSDATVKNHLPIGRRRASTNKVWIIGM